MFRMLVADHNSILLNSLHFFIITNYPDTVVAKTCDPEILMKRVTEENWDVVLFDLNLFRKDGLKVIHNIKQLLPEVIIYVIGMLKEESVVNEVKTAGATGYIPKEKLYEEVLNVIYPLVAAKNSRADS